MNGVDTVYMLEVSVQRAAGWSGRLVLGVSGLVVCPKHGELDLLRAAAPFGPGSPPPPLQKEGIRPRLGAKESWTNSSRRPDSLTVLSTSN